MNIVYEFFRNNHILAICEDALCKKSFTLNLSRFEMTEVPDLVEKCNIIFKLFLNHNHLTKVSEKLIITILKSETKNR